MEAPEEPPISNSKIRCPNWPVVNSETGPSYFIIYIYASQGKVCMHPRNFTGLNCSENADLYAFPS